MTLASYGDSYYIHHHHNESQDAPQQKTDEEKLEDEITNCNSPFRAVMMNLLTHHNLNF
jgi:hypothetical protein